MIYELIEKGGGDIPYDISYDAEREMQQEEKYKDINVANVITNCMFTDTFLGVNKIKNEKHRELYEDYMKRVMNALKAGKRDNGQTT